MHVMINSVKRLEQFELNNPEKNIGGTIPLKIIQNFGMPLVMRMGRNDM